MIFLFDINEIKNPEFIKNLSYKEKIALAEDIRKFLIENLSKTGGHLASNLGVVELMIALYSIFDYKNDQFIFDVGHQAYVHKIFTGRAKDFPTLRKYKGLSGYINRKESPYDIWESGHSSTSISALSGLMLANGKNAQKRVIAIIGDASIVNGVSLEALNYLGGLKDYAPIIILNDNKMGISKSVGSLTMVFNRLRSKKIVRKVKKITNNIFPKWFTNEVHKVKRGIKGYIQRDNIFEDLGFDYYGPIDGHDLKALTKTFERVKDIDGPVIIHILTNKGKGYQFAEADDYGTFHGVGPFNIETGMPLKLPKENEHTYSEIVTEALCKLRQENEFYVITPAMKVGAMLDKFANQYPDNFIDVGIAEEHATVMSAGLALGGKKPILLMYSTFAQRAYDYFLNDICRQNLPVIIGLDRAGVVGADGSTHQGIYDVSMFSGMPFVKIVMPRNSYEIMGVFNTALKENCPVVIRYPRSTERIDFSKYEIVSTPFEWEIIHDGNKGIVLSYGPDLNRILDIVLKNGLDVMVVNARIIKPIDYNLFEKLEALNLPYLIIEEVVESGSLYEKICSLTKQNVYKINFGFDTILPHGSINEVLNDYGFSDNNIIKEIKKLYEN